MKIFKLISLFFFVLATALFMNSCSDDDPGFAKVKVINACPDAPAVDILIDGIKQNPSGIKFPEFTNYINVDPGSRNLKVSAEGSGTPVIDGNVSLEKGKSYSVFTVNVFTKVEPLILLDDLAKPSPGKSRFRFVHVSPDAPPLDVSIKGGPTYPGITFKSATGFSLIDSGTYLVEVRIAGTTPVVASLPGVNLTEGKNYTVFIKGFVNPPAGNPNVLGVQVIVQE